MADAKKPSGWSPEGCQRCHRNSHLIEYHGLNLCDRCLDRLEDQETELENERGGKLKMVDAKKSKPFAGEETAEEEEMEQKGCKSETGEDKDNLEKAEEEEEVDEKEKLKNKKKKAVKGEGISENPEEANAVATDATHSVSPGMGVPSQPQDVFVPQSNVNIAREQNTPMAYAQPAAKSATIDLTKSPLFNGLSEQINDMRKALDARFDSIAKSYNTRLDNMEKTFNELQKSAKGAEDSIKKFYDQPFYKATVDNTTSEMPVNKQISTGKARFSN